VLPVAESEKKNTFTVPQEPVAWLKVQLVPFGAFLLRAAYGSGKDCAILSYRNSPIIAAARLACDVSVCGDALSEP